MSHETPETNPTTPQNTTTKKVLYIAHLCPYDMAQYGYGTTHRFSDREEFEAFRASKGSRCDDYSRWIYHVRTIFNRIEEGYDVDSWYFDYGVNNDGSVSKTPYGHWNQYHADFKSFPEI